MPSQLSVQKAGELAARRDCCKVVQERHPASEPVRTVRGWRSALSTQRSLVIQGLRLANVRVFPACSRTPYEEVSHPSSETHGPPQQPDPSSLAHAQKTGLSPE